MSDYPVLWFIFAWVVLYFVYLAGQGIGYKEAAREWSCEEDEVPNFQWPTCPTCEQGITVHRCGENSWQSSCKCGFAWCNNPYEALLCKNRNCLGENNPYKCKPVESDHFVVDKEKENV